MNKGKKWFVNLQRIVFICIILGIEIFLGNSIYHSQVTQEQDNVEETLYNPVGYETDGTNFKQVKKESYFCVRNSTTVADQIIVEFEKGISRGQFVNVYYSDGEYFDESRVVMGTELRKNSKSCTIDLGGLQCKALRIDLKGKFAIKDIQIVGHREATNVAGVVILAIVCLLLDCKLFAWIFKNLTVDQDVVDALGELYVSYDKWNTAVYDRIQSWNLSVEKFFVIGATVMGVLFSVLVPISQNPDEPAHMEMIGQEVGIQGLSQQYEKYIEKTKISAITADATQKVDTVSLKKNLWQQFDYSKLSFAPRLSINIVRHFPASVGILVGVILHLPIYFCLQLAEFLSLAFYIWMGWKCLQKIPVKKGLFCMIMLLPMTLHQCASINYDAVIIPLIFWVITIIKPPYILLLGLLLMIPGEKWQLHFRKDGTTTNNKLLFVGCGCVFVVAAAIFVIMYYPSRVDFVMGNAQNAGKFLKLLGVTITERFKDYKATTIGRFGWLDCYLPEWLVNVSWILLLFMTQETREEESEKKVKTLDRVLSLGVFLVIGVLIFAAMLSWTYSERGWNTQVSARKLGVYMGKIPFISGVQGRYFIPILPLLLVPASGIHNIKSRNYCIPKIVCYGCLFVVSVVSIWGRYW